MHKLSNISENSNTFDSDFQYDNINVLQTNNYF